MRTRRLLLDSLSRLRAEGPSSAVALEPDKFLWRAISITVEPGGDWKTLGAEYMKARLGEGFGYQP